MAAKFELVSKFQPAGDHPRAIAQLVEGFRDDRTVQTLLAATSALVSREDVIIVASVSCIYGLGSPSDYKRMMIHLPKGQTIDRDQLLLKLVDIQYERNDVN